MVVMRRPPRSRLMAALGCLFLQACWRWISSSLQSLLSTMVSHLQSLNGTPGYGYE